MSLIKNALKTVIPEKLRAALREKTPMQRVLAELQNRGVRLHLLDALEVFGRDGHWHTRDYADKVHSLEVWELQEKYLESLYANLPGATVKIVDSYQQIQRTKKQYDLVVIDNSMGIFVDDPYAGETPTTYCEHFELFPDVFRVLHDRALIILNVIPQTTERALKKYPQLFGPEQLLRRSEFYGSTHPESILLPEMQAAYARIAGQNGWHTEWTFTERRGPGIVYYLVMSLRKITPP